MRYYLDSAPIIYSVETTPNFYARVDAILATPGIILVSSEIARLECRVLPLRNNNISLLRDFDEYFSNTLVELIPLDSYVVDLATEIRAKYNFKTPDAFHLAAAMSARCDVFLTNDFRLSRFTELSIQVV